MPEIFAGLGLEAGAQLGADAALQGGADAAFGGFADLAAAGLPFAAGAGELGQVATGVGPLGVTGFGDAAGLAAGLAGTDLPFGAALAGADLPFGAGAPGPGMDATLPAAAGLTAGGPLNLTTPNVTGGVTAVGPTAGTPTGPFNLGGFDAAGGTTPAAPGAVAPVGAAGNAPVDLAGAAAAGGGPKAAEPVAKGFLDKLGGNAVDNLTKNPLGLAATGGLLGMTLLNKPQTPGIGAGAGALNKTAGQLGQQAPELMQHLTAGTLPAGMKAGVDEATKAAKTRAISNAAAQGQPTDPAKNTVLAAQLDAIDRQAVITTAELGQRLMDTGLKETGLTTDIYNKLIGIGQQEDAATRDAIAKFAAALGGTQGGINLKLA